MHMHIYKFNLLLVCLATFLAYFIIISESALLVVLPKTYTHVKRKNITWRNENFNANYYMPTITSKQTTLKPTYEVSSENIEPEFHFIRHFRQKRRKQLEKERAEMHLQQSPFVSLEQKLKVKPTTQPIKDSYRKPARRKLMQNKSLLRSLMS